MKSLLAGFTSPSIHFLRCLQSVQFFRFRFKSYRRIVVPLTAVGLEWIIPLLAVSANLFAYGDYICYENDKTK